MKRILIFSLAYYPHVGGAEVAIKEITDRITDIEWHMVTMRFGAHEALEEQIGNVHVYRIDCGRGRVAKALFQFAAYWKARGLHKQHQYAAIWAMMAHATGVPAALFKRAYPSVPFVLTLQEGDPIDHIERTMLPLWPFFVQAFARADRVQAISTYLGAWARRRGFRGSLNIIPNGVDSERFAGAPVTHEGTRLVTTSRLVHKNALDAVIRALQLLPEVTFKILGIGPDQTKLEHLAATLGVSDRVEFVGHVAYNDIPAHLHAADIFIRPSRSEGMGNSFIEAMAAGIPVIATQVGGIADFLFDAVRNPDKPTTGWAVDVDSPEQIAAQVRAIMSDSVHTQQVTAQALSMVVEKYDWSTIARSMREQVFVLL